MKEQPNYFAIIPAYIRYDSELVNGEKILFGEITALCDKKGFCWATNSYFANLYDTTEKTISRWINHLKAKKYIDTKLFYKEGTKKIEKRCIKIVSLTVTSLNQNDDQESGYADEISPVSMDKNVHRGIDKNVHRGMDKNVQENNTSINNIKKEIYKEKKIEVIKNIYGEFENVLLTSEEYNKLTNKFDDFNDRIENLSCYLENNKNKKYDSHYAVILNWSRKETKQLSRSDKNNMLDKLNKLKGD